MKMLKITKVLHAHDFSPAARTAMKYATRLAASLNVPLDVLHIVPSIGPAQFLEIDLTRAAEDSDESVRNIAARLTEAHTILRTPSDGESDEHVRYVIGHSPLPAPAILEFAAMEKSSLIVLGAHGIRASEEGQLGSVASELIQRSACPVMLVPERVPEGAADEAIERIVTYISFAHLVQPVIVFAFRIARVFGAQLDILALTNGGDPKTGIPDVEQSPVALRSTLHRQLLRAVETDAAESGQPFENVNVHLRSGHDVNTILSFAREQRSDLLVVEAPGLAAFESPLERMVERIVNNAPCPVVVVNTCGQGSVRKQNRRRAAAPFSTDIA